MKLFLLALFICTSVAYAALPRSKVDFPAPGVVRIGSWTESERNAFYYESTGGSLLPTDWMQALEYSPRQSERFEGDFTSPEIMHDAMGFPIHAGRSGRPLIGFAETELKEHYYASYDLLGKFQGVNCAACHTGELHYKGETLWIDGGSGRVNLEKFIDRIQASLEDTAWDYFRLVRFTGKVSTGFAVLQPAIRGYANAYSQIKTKEGGIEEGPGRSDTISKGASAFALLNEENRQVIDSPVSIPSLWNTQKFDRFHVSSSIQQSLGRDISATTGGGAATDLRKGDKQFNSNIDIRALHRMEELVERLTPPRWPDTVLGKLNVERVETGRRLYDQRCATCHALAPGADGKFQTTTISLETIGTDPNAARKMGSTVIDAEEYGLGRLPAFKMFERITTGVMNYQFNKLGMSADERRVYTGGITNTWSAPLAYKANPLHGIWATPPYLHNGSVVSLRELLLPAAKRTPRFRMCIATEYDPVNVGYVANEKDTSCTLIDTAISGNRNTGHEYGTDLGESDRMALVEYLKSI